MRVFFAIFPPIDIYGRFFADLYKHLDKEKRNLDFTPIDQIHLNIKFLGANVSNDSLNSIIDLIKSFEGQYSKPFIKIRNIQFGFKHQSNPNYVIADIFPSDSLVSLSNEIHKLVKYLDFKDTIRWKSRHDNTFHISLARKKKPKMHGFKNKLGTLLKDFYYKQTPEFTAESLYVINSIVTSSGPIYKKIDKIIL